MTRKARYSVDNLFPLNLSPESKEMRSEVFAAKSVLRNWCSETHIHMEEQKKGKRKVTFGSVEQELGMFPSRHRVLQWTDKQTKEKTNKQAKNLCQCRTSRETMEFIPGTEKRAQRQSQTRWREQHSQTCKCSLRDLWWLLLKEKTSCEDGWTSTTSLHTELWKGELKFSKKSYYWNYMHTSGRHMQTHPSPNGSDFANHH